jgi:hypothetical protein
LLRAFGRLDAVIALRNGRCGEGFVDARAHDDVQYEC